jgi:hypothetical protein
VPSTSCGIGADDILVAALAMRHQGEQVRLRAGRHEQGRFETEIVRKTLLQGIDGGIFAIDVIADLGIEHGLAHRARGPGDGIAAQVDPIHDVLIGAGGDHDFAA